MYTYIYIYVYIYIYTQISRQLKQPLTVTLWEAHPHIQYQIFSAEKRLQCAFWISYAEGLFPVISQDSPKFNSSVVSLALFHFPRQHSKFLHNPRFSCLLLGVAIVLFIHSDAPLNGLI